MAEMFKLEPVPETDPLEADQAHDAGRAMLRMGLGALSKRAVAALPSVFALPAVGSAFWLWMVTLPNPTTYQLIGLGLYGALIIALHLVKRRE